MEKDKSNVNFQLMEKDKKSLGVKKRGQGV
jgi:hypothetical protein